MNHRDPIPYAAIAESVPSDESEDICRVVQTLKALLQRNHDKTGHFHGDVHVKIHGCAEAEFRVLPNLPPELAQGLFKNERRFSAVVRFSNSASQPQTDLIPDGRGLAIKVFDVDGERLDSDAMVEWPESESPYRTVALLLIPRQEIDTEQQKVMCRQVAFNVWHTITDHRPLGGINRLRREVYPISAAWRLQEADAPPMDTA